MNRRKMRRTCPNPHRCGRALIPLTGAEEWLMRIDEQQGMARGALGRSYGPHIRALCYQQILEFVVGQIAAQFAYLGVLGSGDGLDFLGPQAAAPIDELVIKSIAIEGQDVPRLKSGDEARLDLGIA